MASYTGTFNSIYNLDQQIGFENCAIQLAIVNNRNACFKFYIQSWNVQGQSGDYVTLWMVI